MEPFQTKAVLTKLVAIVQALSGMQGTVGKGVPEALATRVSAYVTVAGQAYSLKVAQKAQKEGRWVVVFGYRVKGAEATAEDSLADLIDAFVTAILADMTLGGLVGRVDLDFGGVGDALYSTISGSEFRLYPIGVVATQTQQYSLP
jgi:hypothetical protein